MLYVYCEFTLRFTCILQTDAKIETVQWEIFGDQSDDLHGNRSPLPSGKQEWTALGDESANALLGEGGWEDDDDDDDSGKGPRFQRKAWSMRPTASQAVNIITGLQRARTRSLSNTSIDGEAKTGRRPNTEERPLDVILRRKTWEMYLKQTHRVPGVCVCVCVCGCVGVGVGVCVGVCVSECE